MTTTRADRLSAHSGLHLAPLGLFAVLACAWSYPLVLHLSTAVPGPGAGDNLTFVWNLWWMRHVLASPADHFFFTRYLFAPFGTDLTLHTHAALPDLVGATLLGRVGLIPATNLLVLGSLFLNAAAAYLLAWELTRDRWASVVAGVIFGGSPYVMAHLYGHFNLVAAWGLPLFALCVHRTLCLPGASAGTRGVQGMKTSLAWSAAAGAALAAVAYTDYYYFIYAALLALLYAVSASIDWSVSWIRRRPSHLWPTRLVVVLLSVSLAFAATIAVSGGWAIQVGGVRVSMTRATNLLTACWALLILFAALRWTPISKLRRVRTNPREALRLLAPLAAVLLVSVLPLAILGFELWQSGDYASPAYFWRSSARGIDLVALVSGNPLHPLWRNASQSVFARLGMDRVEGVAWLGLAPLLILATNAWRQRANDQEARRWWMMGAVFLVWALGPFLVVGGINAGLPLPAFLVRYLPVVANARIPGRAMVVVYLAAAVLVSKALAALGGSPRRRAAICGAAAVVVCLDFLAAPIPLLDLEVPHLYETLRNQPAGARSVVCELPLGIRDGFGQQGSLDHAVLFYQTVHQHPLVGGFVARLSPRLRSAYETDATLGPLLRLSSGESAEHLRLGQDAASRIRDGLDRLGVGYVVLNRATASPDLTQIVERMPGLRSLERNGTRELFALGR
jgi:hypothetical protein